VLKELLPKSYKFNKFKKENVIMRKLAIYSVLILAVLFYCKKDSSNNSSSENVTITGTVYLDNVPTEDVTVEATFSVVSPRVFTKSTGENGKYTFSEPPTRPNTYFVSCKIRALNPIDNIWTEFTTQRISVGETFTKDFYLTSI